MNYCLVMELTSMIIEIEPYYTNRVVLFQLGFSAKITNVLLEDPFISF